MKTKMTQWLIIGFALSLSATAFGKGTREWAKSRHFAKLQWLGISDVELILRGVDTPAEGSATDHNDLLEMRKMHADRTAEACKQAMREASCSYEDFFGPPHNLLSSAEIKAVAPLMGKLFSEVDVPVWMMKEATDRVRPHHRKEGIRTCPEVPAGYKPGSSFPSGHTAISRIQAIALGELFPARREAFLKRAEEVGQGRVLLGVHHPSDVVVGTEIATKTWARLMQKEKFRAELSDWKARFAAGAASSTKDGTTPASGLVH